MTVGNYLRVIAFRWHAPSSLTTRMIFLCLLLSGHHLGYIDPNAGGWLFQLFFPVFIAILGLWTVVKKKIEMFRARQSDQKNKKPLDHK